MNDALLHVPFHYLHMSVFTWMSCAELKLHWSSHSVFLLSCKLAQRGLQRYRRRSNNNNSICIAPSAIEMLLLLLLLTDRKSEDTEACLRVYVLPCLFRENRPLVILTRKWQLHYFSNDLYSCVRELSVARDLSLDALLFRIHCRRFRSRVSSSSCYFIIVHAGVCVCAAAESTSVQYS